ncbi:hypothetical protein ACS0TY_024020 [Phlomoides rotata]
MDFATVLVAVLVLVWACFHLLRSGPRGWRGKLPPGPYPFPIIGNAHKLGKNPHQSLANLSKTYGPLMSLQLGSVYTVVASSPEIAKEILLTNDRVFSGRPIPSAVKIENHHKISVAYLPVGDKWRKLRKICREQMFSSQQLDASHGLRQEKLQKLRDYVRGCCTRGRVVNIADAAFVTSLNLITATLFSVDFTNFDSDVTQELKECLQGAGKIAAAPNLADFFPVLEKLDPQGLKKEAEFYLGKLLSIIGDTMNQRLESRRGASEKKSDMLEALLDMSTEYELSFEEMQHLLADLLFAGTETASITVEWTMTELLMNPEKMSRATNELRRVVGEKNRVEESDISRLPYLQAVIKETFRYHPAAPLLVPHKAEDEAKINGYTIPKNAQILVNVWAMGRDASIWENPNMYEPERFLDNSLDFKGQDFELIPFGSGRRICPGLPLADRMVHLMVASLVNDFDWKFEAEENIDLTEKFGLALHKAVPLRAIPMFVDTT